MSEITFTDYEGVSRTLHAEPGSSLMEIARANGIPGIDADCGGVCACATCHVYIDEAFLDRLPPPGDCEEPMLEFVDEVRANSRLACQVNFSRLLDGIKVTTPQRQK